MLRSRMVRTATHKYIHRVNGQHDLYDLVVDPDEMHNRIGDPSSAPVVEELRNRLLERMIQAETTLPEVERLYA